MSSSRAKSWERFWAEAPEEGGAVLWDAGPEVTAARHLPLFTGYFDKELPVVDVGCGNGTQTRFLAAHYGRVHGIDLSAAAVERARRADDGGAASYEQLDATELEGMRRLHGAMGDANVYMRGVLHQCPAEERPALAAGVAVLTGGRGRVFAVELAESVGGLIQELVRRGEGLPAKLEPVLRHGIAPAEMADGEVPRLLGAAGLEVLERGAMPLVTTEREPDGSWLEFPSNWLVAGRSG